MKMPPYEKCQQCGSPFPVPMMSPFCAHCLKLRRDQKAYTNALGDVVKLKGMKSQFHEIKQGDEGSE